MRVIFITNLVPITTKLVVGKLDAAQLSRYICNMGNQLVAAEGGRSVSTACTDVTFDKNFAFEIALQYYPIETIMQKFEISLQKLRQLRKHAPFVIAVRDYQKEIKTKGISFKLKAQVMAEELMGDAYLMAKDKATPASVRTKNIENMVRWAELEPAKNPDASGSGGATFQVQINL